MSVKPKSDPFLYSKGGGDPIKSSRRRQIPYWFLVKQGRSETSLDDDKLQKLRGWFLEC